MSARHLIARLLYPAFALLVALGGPALADSCGAPASASTSGITTIDLLGMKFITEQTAFLERVSGGGGYDGDWVVTEWSTLTTLPMADPLFAQRGGMLPVPDWKMTCTGKSLSPTQSEGTCVGRVPLVVKNGKIAFAMGGKPIGKITPAKGTLPAEMTINLLPIRGGPKGGVDWTMTGVVTPSQSPKLTSQLIEWHTISAAIGGTVGRAYTLHVQVEPPLTKYIHAIDASVSRNGSIMPAAAISPVGSTVLGRTFLLNVSGASAKSRQYRIDASTIVATMNAGGCDVSQSWPLSSLIAAANYPR